MMMMRPCTEQVLTLYIPSLPENRCPSCTIPFERLLEILPAMKPRRYSAASSPLADPESVRFILNVVDQGLCSTWLDTLGSAMGGAASTETGGCSAALPGRLSRSVLVAKQVPSAPLVPLFREKKTAGSFNPPADTAVPMIMIGPGTGVAPFLGFLQHRHAQRAASPDASYGASWMFFGNRNEMKDALCRSVPDWKPECGRLQLFAVLVSPCAPCAETPRHAVYPYMQR